MSLKKNILANYASQIYVTVIGIVMVPAYVKYMGPEAYGLVGVFAMLQAWFQLLDVGLTPTMARETARFNGGVSDALSLRRLLRALEGVFGVVAIVGSGSMIAAAGMIAERWLKVDQLPLNDVQQAVMLMAVTIALRWMSGLYRGVINGFERLDWLSGFNILVATARFVLVIPLFVYIGAGPTDFFQYQLVVALVEVVVLGMQAYRLLPKTASSDRLPWHWSPLTSVLSFSLGIAFTSSVWVLVTQTDKLILSKVLPLAEYAYFTLAVLVASGVMVISGPISAALLPRLTKLAASGNEAGLIDLYRNATQLVGVIAVPTALVLVFFSEQVLWAWTGNREISQQAAPVLRLYALGNGILTLAAFPYYLQFAKGNLRLHLIGNALFVTLLIPMLIWAAVHKGAIGAGYAWVFANSIYFILWTPYVHHRFFKGLHIRWLTKDLGMIVGLTLIAVVLVRLFVPYPDERIALALSIGITSLVLLLVAAVASTFVKEQILRNKCLSSYFYKKGNKDGSNAA